MGRVIEAVKNGFVKAKKAWDESDIPRMDPQGASQFTELGQRRDLEISPETYLESLSLADRERVTGLVEAIKGKSDKFGGLELGVIAVGSTVQPEGERGGHSPEDIDIRLITSALPYSKKQQDAAGKMIGIVFNHLQRRYPFKFKDTTGLGQNSAPVRSFDKEGNESGETTLVMSPREDPMFFVESSENGQLPIEIYITPFGPDTLGAHLVRERAEGKYFSLLGRFS